MELICDIPPAMQPQPMPHILSTMFFIHCSPTALFLQMEYIFPQQMDTMLIKVLLKHEFSHGPDAKKTWLKCQGYDYEPNPAGIAAASRDTRQIALRKLEQITLY